MPPYFSPEQLAGVIQGPLHKQVADQKWHIASAKRSERWFSTRIPHTAGELEEAMRTALQAGAHTLTADQLDEAARLRNIILLLQQRQEADAAGLAWERLYELTMAMTSDKRQARFAEELHRDQRLARALDSYAGHLTPIPMQVMAARSAPIAYADRGFLH
jgi:hypothetical protein